MLHPPTIRKQPKKYDKQPQNEEKIETTKKQSNKPITQTIKPPRNTPSHPQSIPQKVQKLENAVEKLSLAQNGQIQGLLLQEIQGIKSELREIKQQIGIKGHKKVEYQQEPQEQEQQCIYNQPNEGQWGQQAVSSEQLPRQPNYLPQQSYSPPHPQPQSYSPPNPQSQNASQGSSPVHYQTYQPHQLLEIGKIQPYMKQFKLQASKIPLAVYPGYHKKSSKPVIIKYCGQSQSMQNLMNIYQKLWKNIVKAKKICINKIYDLNQPMAHNIIAIQMNQHHINDITIDKIDIIRDVLRAIQFIHQCGLLYRDLHPSHVMQSYEGNIVLLGLGRTKRYTDIKGRNIQVRATENQHLHQFVSNARLRSCPEGRKDDLQTIGYLGLYLMEGRLPWTMDNILKVRSKSTLQGLFSRHRALLQYMTMVYRLQTQETPNYNQLHQILK